QHLVGERFHLEDMPTASSGHRHEHMAAGTFEWNVVPCAPGLDERVELHLCRLLRDAVLQTADQIEIVIASVQSVGRIEPERQPYLGAVVHHVGAGWHDA